MKRPARYRIGCRRRFRCRMREDGLALVCALILMLAGAMLALSSGRTALGLLASAERERDHAVARAAAEAALDDGERDIAGAGPPARTAAFAAEDGAAFAVGCGTGPFDRGLCRESEPPAWQTLDLPTAAAPVPYGSQTGARMAVGTALLAARLPVYLIERLDGGSGTLYRITAAGFGTRATTVVVLQAVVRRSAPDGAAPVPRRIGWRDIANWPELHAMAAH